MLNKFGTRRYAMRQQTCYAITGEATARLTAIGDLKDGVMTWLVRNS